MKKFQPYLCCCFYGYFPLLWYKNQILKPMMLWMVQILIPNGFPWYTYLKYPTSHEKASLSWFWKTISAVQNIYLLKKTSTFQTKKIAFAWFQRIYVSGAVHYSTKKYIKKPNKKSYTWQWCNYTSSKIYIEIWKYFTQSAL